MKRIVSGITPSGDGSLHIGNYLGAVRQFKEMAATFDCFLFVADYHALTTIQKKTTLEKNIESLILNELSLLGDLTNITFFRQSDVPEHTELQTIISNITPLGLIKRAHAYKDKLQKDISEEEINMGLFNYPVLMAADILMYNADLVPVGKDQKQHVEITRDIAQRFNKTFKPNFFTLPDAFIREDVAVVLGTDGQRKMSKSLGNIISIFEDEAVIKKQVMGCYTDPTRAHANDPGHVEGNMVFTYLDYFGDREQVDQLKEAYQHGTVADVELKDYLFTALMKTFGPARSRYAELKQNPKEVQDILKSGALKARTIAQKTLKEVRSAIGLTTSYSFSMGGAITIDEFSRVEMQVGQVTEAQNVEKSEKLIRLSVDFGPGGKKTIFTGVRTYGYGPEDFIHKQFFFVTNLEPRKMPSYVTTSAGKIAEESQGMIMAVDGPDGKPLFVSAEHLPLGAKIR